jgi:hypothetical protein
MTYAKQLKAYEDGAAAKEIERRGDGELRRTKCVARRIR